MARAQSTTSKRHRKQFVEKDRALELAASIVDVQEQKSQAKVDRLQVSHEPKDKQSSKSRLKEAMVKLSAQSKAKKRRRRAKVTGVKTDSIKATSKRVAFACE